MHLGKEFWTTIFSTDFDFEQKLFFSCIGNKKLENGVFDILKKTRNWWKIVKFSIGEFFILLNLFKLANSKMASFHRKSS